jgi:hypothetical protein
MMVYLRPWTLRSEDETMHCPLLSKLRQGCSSWAIAWHKYLDGGILSCRHQATISNFQEVFSIRQEESIEGGSKDMDRCTVDLTATELEQALRTKRHVSAEDGTNASFDFAAATWGSTNSDKSGQQRKNYAMPCDLSKALDAARASQKQKQAEADLPNSSSSAKVSVSTSCNDVAGLVIRWLKQVTSGSTGGSDTGLRCKNTKQIKVVQMIAKRVLQEHQDAVDTNVGRSKPLCALVTGGPGFVT